MNSRIEKLKWKRYSFINPFIDGEPTVCQTPLPALETAVDKRPRPAPVCAHSSVADRT